MNSKNKTIFHVVSLVLSIFAIAFMIGGEIETVDAFEPAVYSVQKVVENIGFFEKLVNLGDAGKTSRAAAKIARQAARADSTGGFFWQAVGDFILGPVLGAAAGVALGMGIYAFAFGASNRNIQSAWVTAAIAGGSGVVAGSIALYGGAFLAMGPFAAAAVVALVIFGAVQLFVHKNYSKETYKYQVGVWQPSTDGSYCERCNDLKYGCSEYQCKSYGLTCELINEASDDQRCIRTDPTGFNPTVIEINESDINNDYIFEYGENGVTITKPNGDCLDPFKGLEFSVNTNMPSQCRWGVEKKPGFSEYPYFANGGASHFVEKHKIVLLGSAYPSAYQLQSNDYVIKDGTFENNIYLSCMSYYGEESPFDFSVQFCIDDGPDTSSPVIESVNPLNGAFLRSGTTQIPVTITTDEDANCKWDYLDKNYKEMKNSFSHCTVSENADPVLACHKAILDSLEKGKNKFYFRCADKPFFNKEATPQERVMENAQSYIYTLEVSDNLRIDEILINNNGSGSTFKSNAPIDVTFDVSTSIGADGSGQAICYSKKTGSSAPYIQFLKDDMSEYSSINSGTVSGQGRGVHKYDIMCCDKAHNCISENINFTVEIDDTPPMIARIYNEGGEMKVITTESSECVYSLSERMFTFEDGIPFSTYDGLEHTTGWDPDSELFILCKDEYDNVPTECQIIARASDM
ncbi:MAG: hypothetical protein PF542_01385 [Nanoarchaeota archaeon]|nr:hypothetical protein [Nanoarchaeota archaeon]